MLNKLPSSISALLDARADGHSLPAGYLGAIRQAIDHLPSLNARSV